MSLRKIIRMRGSFPNEEAGTGLVAALNRFSILWPDRMPARERA
jgi:hypothetical protein